MRDGAEIRILRKIQRLSQEGLAKLVGVSRSAVYDWERNAYSPEGENLINLAKSLNVSAAYLMGETDTPDTQKETDNPPIKIDYSLSRGKIISVPVIDKAFAACCGGGFTNPEYAERMVMEYIDMPSGFLGAISPDPDKLPFIIYTEGDSMIYAGIFDGAMLIINPIEPVLDGDTALVEYESTPGTMSVAAKRVYWLDHGGIEIRSACGDNWKRSYGTDEIKTGSLRIIGKVMWSGNKPKKG